MRTLPKPHDAAGGREQAAGGMPLSFLVAALDERRHLRLQIGFSREDALKLLITDPIYEHPTLSELAKQRLAIANAEKQRHASTTQLQATLGQRKERILATVAELEAAGLATFDRAKPGQWINPTTRRAHNVIRIAPEADWNHPMNERRRICLPHTVTAETAEAFNRSPSPVEANQMLLYYQREQLKRRAIEVADPDLARLLNWPTRKVRLIREWSKKAGIIERVGDGEVAEVYIFPDRFTIFGSEPADFDTHRTRRLLPLWIGGTPLLVFAHPAELEVAALRVSALVPEEALRIAAERGVWRNGSSALKPILAGLDEAVGNLAPPSREPHTPELGTTTKPRSLEAPERSSYSAKTGREPVGPSEAPEDDLSEREGRAVRRREWGAEWANVYYQADDATHARVEAIIRHVEATYGHAEARSFLREACLDSGGSGRRALARLERRWPHVEQSVDHDIGAALDAALRAMPE